MPCSEGVIKSTNRPSASSCLPELYHRFSSVVCDKNHAGFYVLTKVCILDMSFAGDKLCQDKHAKKAKAEYIRRHKTVPCLPEPSPDFL